MWDDFVERSPQGTIFSTSRWLTLFDKEFWIYGCYKGEELVGGMAFFVDDEACCSGGARTPLTPFQGILVCPPRGMKAVNVLSLQTEVAEVLIDSLDEFLEVEVANHYTFHDVRPFIWEGFNQSVRYTFIVDTRNLIDTWENMEKDTRNMVNKAEKTTHVMFPRNIDAFDTLYSKTFNRKGIERPISKEFMNRMIRFIDSHICMIYQEDTPLAGAVFIRDSKRAYYILGASEKTDTGAPYKALWQSMKLCERDEVDLVGCNAPAIAHFKKGFGGRLEPYYCVTKTL